MAFRRFSGGTERRRFCKGLGDEGLSFSTKTLPAKPPVLRVSLLASI